MKIKGKKTNIKSGMCVYTFDRWCVWKDKILVAVVRRLCSYHCCAFMLVCFSLAAAS